MTNTRRFFASLTGVPIVVFGNSPEGFSHLPKNFSASEKPASGTTSPTKIRIALSGR
jgi:hypothetical protein